MKHDTYFDIVWRQFRKNRFAYVALWLLSPLVLVAIFAPILASNIPFYFHDSRQTLVCDTAETTPVFLDIGYAIPLDEFRADERNKAAEADEIAQAEAEAEAGDKNDADKGIDALNDTATSDASEANGSTDTSAEDEESSDLSTLKAPETEVEKAEFALDSFEKKFAEAPFPWLVDNETERLWVRRGNEVYVYKHIGQRAELNAAQPLMILTDVDRPPQIPGRITNIDWFQSEDQTLILRQGEQTLVFQGVKPPTIESIEGAANGSQQTQQVQQTESDEGQATQQTGAEFSIELSVKNEPGQSYGTLVFEATTMGNDALENGDQSNTGGFYRISYDLPEPVTLSPTMTFAFMRSMAQYPWFRALLNPGASVDYMFNVAMICFIPWMIFSVLMYRFWRKKEVSGRLAALRLVGIYGLIIIVVACFFSIDMFRPSNKWKERTFTAEAMGSSYMKWGVYPPIPFGPAENDAGASGKPPGFVKPAYEASDSNDRFPHILGTDTTGADTLTRMIYGTRISLSVGIVAVGIYMTIGIIIGAIAGYFGGWVDMILSRCIEVVMLFPALFLVLTIVALWGKSIYVVMVVIGITGWPGIARLTRGEVLKQRQIEYVTAARSLGGSNFRIIFRHILPNALSPAMVAAPFGIAGAIITEAGLSLLGFGAEPSEPTWGNLLNIANNDYSLWWLIIFPTIAIFTTVTLLNLIGNGLRDAMDPRLRR